MRFFDQYMNLVHELGMSGMLTVQLRLTIIFGVVSLLIFFGTSLVTQKRIGIRKIILCSILSGAYLAFCFLWDICYMDNVLFTFLPILPVAIVLIGIKTKKRHTQNVVQSKDTELDD